MSWPSFLDLPQVEAAEADLILLPLPYEGTVSYGQGAALGPEAIWEASTQIELWDEQFGVDLSKLRWHTAPAVFPEPNEVALEYLTRVEKAAAHLNRFDGLVIGVGGEHSVSLPLVRAACGKNDFSDVTIVQLDAHADLRDTYDDTPCSHACAMRRLVERSAKLIAIGIRSVDREEAQFAADSDRITTFAARELSADLLPGETARESELLETLRTVRGKVYLTIDIDALEVHLCPATGTPQPGGLRWWQTIRYLHALLVENRECRLIGADLVETVPQPGTRVNEFTAAMLLTKVAALFDTASHTKDA
ncbi:MAG: agmatinase [Planctomycetia bacterium]|jgi:agmatinase